MIITLLRKVYDVLEALRLQIMAAQDVVAHVQEDIRFVQDVVAHVQEDIRFVQRKLGIIPYTYDNWRLRNLLVPRMFIPQIWDRIVSDHVLDAAKYGMVGIKAMGTDKVKIVRPPEMYFGVDWARDEKNG